MTSQPDSSTGDLQVAVRHAMKLLSAGKTALAVAQAREVLRVYPQEINSQFVLASGLRATGEPRLALQALQDIVNRAPDFALAQQELGFAWSDAGSVQEAIAALRRAVALEPGMAASWQLLGELLLADGDEEAAAAAFNQVIASSEHADLVRVVALLQAGKVGQAERLCRNFLMANPSNVNAIRLLAEIGIKLGVYDEAELLLERCLELAPDFRTARLNYAMVLSQRNKLEAALAQVEGMLAREPDALSLLTLKASVLVKMADFAAALPVYRRLLSEFPPRARIALSYGHALKTVGEQEHAIAAYRQAVTLQPGFGDAWWSMANLKTFRFNDDDLDIMRHELRSQDNSMEDHFHLSFALGKALEDRGEFRDSFRFYDLGNRAKIKLEGYSADENHADVCRMIEVCSRELMNSPRANACQASDPIFIVGLPRSGSTLLEQILASHSLVDGTKELPDILALTRRLGGRRKRSDRSRYPEVLCELSDTQLRDLGAEYLERTRIQRGDAAFFIDKMPNNFLHVGFISLILPAAKIIDARRHPMAACFSGFTQLFAKGQPFTYGLSNIGRYYRDYVAMMDHWDEVLPGKVLRVQYEEVVADTETQVRRLLDYCGLPFEQACLEFHQTRRAVRTASSEQVRQPIYTSGLAHWRHYEADLDELKQALGPVLERYPID